LKSKLRGSRRSASLSAETNWRLLMKLRADVALARRELEAAERRVRAAS
jgi:hypothetical protein